MLKLLGDLLAPYSAVFGSFPGWWIGSAEGRYISPCVGLTEWGELLRDSGFAGCDRTTPSRNPFTHPMMVFVAQAVDDKVAIPRKPLSSPTKRRAIGRSTIIKDLVLVGGDTPDIKELIVELRTLAEQHCDTIRTARTLGDLNQLSISSITTVLNLVDLEQPTFHNLDEGKCESLKFLFHNAGKILRTTKGCRAAEPHANMLIRLLRTARFEIPGLEFQFIDFEDLKRVNSGFIAEALLRFSAATMWKQDCNGSPFFAVEEELVVDKGGQILVPRLVPNKGMNDRYNSSRRSILKPTNMNEATASIVSKNGVHILRNELLGLPGAEEYSTRGQLKHLLWASNDNSGARSPIPRTWNSPRVDKPVSCPILEEGFAYWRGYVAFTAR